MTKKNRFYVYAYLDPRKPGKYKYGEYEFDHEPFYIGKGCGNRMMDHLKTNRKINTKNSFKNNKVKKILSLNINIVPVKVIQNVSEEKALNMEKNLINLIGRACCNEGPLTNLDVGGYGSSGNILSDKSKYYISKNNARYWKGKKIPFCAIEQGKKTNKNQDRSHKYRTYKVTSPDGKEYVVKNGLQKFCNKHNLLRCKMVSVANGHRNHHKQWKCEITDNKIFPRDKTYRMTNMNTNDTIITNCILDFAKANDLDSRRLYEVARGKRYCHRGWKCEYYNTP